MLRNRRGLPTGDGLRGIDRNHDDFVQYSQLLLKSDHAVGASRVQVGLLGQLRHGRFHFSGEQWLSLVEKRRCVGSARLPSSLSVDISKLADFPDLRK